MGELLATIVSSTVVIVLGLVDMWLRTGNWPPSLKFLLPFNFAYIDRYQIQPVCPSSVVILVICIALAVFIATSAWFRQNEITRGIRVGLLCGMPLFLILDFIGGITQVFQHGFG